ncbi:MAG TPA: MoaD/ThiS family protein [Planctomycetota bacterium]|nr:MoaD/ThiS family protein [Planctomycetota bacterium]
MKVAVQLFGPLAEQAGCSRIHLAMDGSTVRDVVVALASVAPSLKIDSSVRFAVNTDYAEAAAPVRDGDVVSLLPPVGGG